MTQGLEALARRTASMRGIRSVVHTMKALSVTNAAPYEQAARSIRLYHEAVLDGLHAFLTRFGPLELASRGATARVLIVFGSDHGLCGNYNEALAEHVARHKTRLSGTSSTVLCVGAQMADALLAQGITPDRVFLPAASVEGIGRLANLLTQTLEDIRSRTWPHDIAVSLAYVARESANRQDPVIVPLLPLDPNLLADLRAKPWDSRSLPGFSMPPENLFLSLVRNHLFASLFRASAEALLTENAARLALMQQAERSVDERLDELMAETRMVRQNEITTELLDVIIGFEALKSKKAKSSPTTAHRPASDANEGPGHPPSGPPR